LLAPPIIRHLAHADLEFNYRGPKSHCKTLRVGELCPIREPVSHVRGPKSLGQVKRDSHDRSETAPPALIRVPAAHKSCAGRLEINPSQGSISAALSLASLMRLASRLHVRGPVCFIRWVRRVDGRGRSPPLVVIDRVNVLLPIGSYNRSD